MNKFPSEPSSSSSFRPQRVVLCIVLVVVLMLLTWQLTTVARGRCGAVVERWWLKLNCVDVRLVARPSRASMSSRDFLSDKNNYLKYYSDFHLKIEFISTLKT